MEELCKKLKSEGYSLKFIISNKVMKEETKEHTRVAIFIDKESTLDKNLSIIEENIKKNTETRIFIKTKEEILDVL